MFIPKRFIDYTTFRVTVKVDQGRVQTLADEGPVSDRLAAIVNEFEAQLEKAGFRAIIQES